MTFSYFYCPECSDPVALGIGDYTIADEAIIASTEHNNKNYNKHFGRLEGTLGYSAWAAASNNYDQWIGVDFGRRQIITGKLINSVVLKRSC